MPGGNDFLLDQSNLNSQVTKFNELAGDLRSRVEQIDTSIDGLAKAVHGTASGNCVNQWAVAKEAILTHASKIEEIANTLAASGTATNSTDESLSDFTVETAGPTA